MWQWAYMEYSFKAFDFTVNLAGYSFWSLFTSQMNIYSFLACSAPCTQKTVAPADNILIRISKSPAALSDLAGIQRKTFLSRRKLIRANYSNQFTIDVSL